MKSLNTLVSYDRLSMFNTYCLFKKKNNKIINKGKNKNEKIYKNISHDTTL